MRAGSGTRMALGNTLAGVIDRPNKGRNIGTRRCGDRHQAGRRVGTLTSGRYATCIATRAVSFNTKLYTTYSLRRYIIGLRSMYY